MLGLRSGTQVTADVLPQARDLQAVGTERGVVFDAPFSNTRSGTIVPAVVARLHGMPAAIRVDVLCP